MIVKCFTKKIHMIKNYTNKFEMLHFKMEPVWALIAKKTLKKYRLLYKNNANEIIKIQSKRRQMKN